MPKDEIDDFLESFTKKDEIDTFLESFTSQQEHVPYDRKAFESRQAGVTPEEQPETLGEGLKRGVKRGLLGPALGPILTATSKEKAMTKGALDTILAGTPEAIAARSGVNLKDPNSEEYRNPEAYAVGQVGGAIVPLGELTKGALILKEGVKQALKQGARLGGVYGAGQGVSDAAKSPDSTVSDALKGGLTMGAGGAILGGTIRAGVPLTAKGFVSVADALRKSAEKNVSQSLLPTTKNNKAIAERITPEILDNPKETFSFTKRGLEEKTRLKKEEAADAIEDFGKLKGDTQTKPILDALEYLKVDQKHVVEGKVINPEAVKHIDEVKDLIAQYGDSISKEGLRNIKRGFDQATYGQKGAFPNYSEKSLLGFKKIASDEIRELLAKEEPDLAKLNKQFNFWSNYNKVISDTVERTSGQQGAQANVAAIGGAITGNTVPGMIVNALSFRYLMKAIQSPGWKLASAHTKNALADALASQNAKGIGNAINSIDKNLGGEFKNGLIKIVASELPAPKSQQRELSDFERQILLEQKAQ